MLTEQQIDNQWWNYLKETYVYDPQNNCTEYLGQYWYWVDDDAKWVNARKSTYTYDVQNNCTERIEQYWAEDGVDGIWVNESKFIYTYDIQNNMIEELTQSFLSYPEELWLDKEKYIYTYDAQNNTSEMLRQIPFNAAWLPQKKHIYTYDMLNNMIEELIQFNTAGELIEWVNDRKHIYSYDAQNNMVEAIIDYFSNNDGWKYTHTYDIQNNRSETIAQRLQTSQWGNYSKQTYIYDENNNATSGFSYAWHNDTWVGATSVMTVYYNNMESNYVINTGNYGLSHKFTASYIKTGTVSIKDNQPIESAVVIYPNPTSNILHIYTNNPNVISDVRIYSMQGALLLHVKGNQIDVSSLSNGIYIVKVDGISRKIVKQ